MTQPDHLTEEQFAQYRCRALPPLELLEVDGHLAACGSCRDRLYREEHAGTQLRQLRADLDGHLDYDQIAACATGSFPSDVARHLQDCALCRAEVDDLRQFRTELQSGTGTPIQMPARRVFWRLAAAAAVVLAAAAAFWLARPTAGPPPGIASAPKPAVPQEAPLTGDELALVQQARDAGKLERAPILDRLMAKPGVLLGPPTDTKGFELQSPMGTTVMSDRPTFEWKPAAGATRYVVDVFDENFVKVLGGQPVDGAQWRPDQPLPRGRIYNWQVTAEIGGKKVHAPTPPAPEARFQVVSEEVAGRIETARREHPSNHVLLAALYAQAGDVDDANKELDELAATDFGKAAALRQSLK